MKGDVWVKAARRAPLGAALISALVIVAVATTLTAALAFDTGLEIRRSEGLRARANAEAWTAGAEALAASALVEQLSVPSESLHTAQRWAAPLGPVPVTAEGALRAQLIDLQGRFNLNSLVDASGRVDPSALRVFERLLVVLGLEAEWAPRVADWIDADTVPLEGGAEDAVYLGQTPAYRPPNLPVTSPSELLALVGFGSARYALLAPHVSALPRDASINLCTASGPLLDALAEERQWTQAPEALIAARERGCFPGREVFRNTLGDAARFAELDRAVGLAETSRHFRLVTDIRVGTVDFTLYSLLRVETAPGVPARVRLMTRSTRE